MFSNSESKIYAGLSGKNPDESLRDKLVWVVKRGQQVIAEVDTIGPGILTGISHQKATDPKFKDQFILTLKGQETVHVRVAEGAGYTNSLLNALHSLALGQSIYLRAYWQKNKDNPANPFYGVVPIDEAGEMVKWAIPKEQIPQVEIIKTPTKDIKDDSKRVVFFRNLAEQINLKHRQAQHAEHSTMFGEGPARKYPEPTEPAPVADIYAGRTREENIAEVSKNIGLTSKATPAPVFDDQDDDLPF